jgi:hypothetical protein
MSDERVMIERFAKSEGLPISSWDAEHENGLTAKLGRARVVEDDEDHGLYGGDEGELEACVVGSEENRNQRVSLGLIIDGYDEASDVPDISAVEPI